MDRVRVRIHTEDHARAEMAIALLSAIGYDAFEEVDEGLLAYIAADEYDEGALEAMLSSDALRGVVMLQRELVGQQNWNAVWEAQFSPVVVAGRILVRASFHAANPEIEYDIVIDPKMSFGTGHHETTSLMMEMQLDIDHGGKKVLDVGAGTGILSVLASKKGASTMVAIDTDQWSIDNCHENLRRNGVQNHAIYRGSVENITLDHDFDLVLANINRNVLLEEMDRYRQCLKIGGQLLISGFYSAESHELMQKAENEHLHHEQSKTRNRWAAMLFTRRK